MLDRHATGAQLEKLVRSYRGGALVSAGDPLDYSIAVEGLIMRELPDP